MSLARLQLLVDDSASMAGAPFVQVRNFIDHAVLECLRSDSARFGSTKIDLCLFSDELRTVCRDVSLDFFDTGPLEAASAAAQPGPFGPSLAGVLARHLESEARMAADAADQVLYLLISDGQFLDDAGEALGVIRQVCRSPRLAFGVDGAETPALALFENWPYPGFRMLGDAGSATAQDVHEMLKRL